MPAHITYSVDAWLPIRTTIFDDEQCAEVVDSGIGLFLGELPQTLPVVFSEIAEVTISIEEPPKDIAAYVARASSIHAPPLFRCARVGAKVTVERRSVEVPESDRDLNALVHQADAAYYLGRALDLALDLSELSNPGTIWAVEGAVVVDGKILAQIGEKAFISEFHPKAESPSSWPPVSSFSLSSVVTWASSIGMLKAPLAVSRLQRALAAYTNIVGLTSRNEGEVLFRAMQGLEAFYCDGVGDLRRQLAEKSKLWLGSSNATANIVGQLYDLRSQYVHGAAKLQYLHDVADPWEHDEKAMTRLSSGSGFAARLLVASLQRCIADEVIELEWSFSFTTGRNKNGDG